VNYVKHRDGRICSTRWKLRVLTADLGKLLSENRPKVGSFALAATELQPTHSIARPILSMRQNSSSCQAADAQIVEPFVPDSRSRWRVPRRLGQFLIVAVTIASVGFFAWSGSDDSRTGSHSELPSYLRQLTYSPNGLTLAACGAGNQVCIWDVTRRNTLHALRPLIVPDEEMPFAFAFSPDSTALAVGGSGAFTFWTRESDTFRLVFERKGIGCRSLAFSPDGLMLALGGVDGTITICDLPSRRERILYHGDGNNVASVSFSHDGGRLLSTGRTVALWDVVRGAKISLPQPFGSRFINQIGAFSPDGSTLALGDLLCTPPNTPRITLIDANTGAVRVEMSGHRLGISALAFSPDGSTLAIAGIDQNVRLWDVVTGIQKSGMPKRVESAGAEIAFSPTGNGLAFGNGDGQMQVWDWKWKD
jgi:WD40 repeat protein